MWCLLSALYRTRELENKMAEKAGLLLITLTIAWDCPAMCFLTCEWECIHYLVWNICLNMLSAFWIRLGTWLAPCWHGLSQETSALSTRKQQTGIIWHQMQCLCNWTTVRKANSSEFCSSYMLHAHTDPWCEPGRHENSPTTSKEACSENQQGGPCHPFIHSSRAQSPKVTAH